MESDANEVKPTEYEGNCSNSFRSSIRLFSVGSTIPSTSLFEGSPGNEIDLARETTRCKSIVVGVPGAFSPGCTASHIPGFIKHLLQFKTQGYDKIFVVAVNDAFVTKAWGESLDASSSDFRFLADPAGAFSKELGTLFDASKFFGNERSKRYTLLVDDSKIVKSFVEPDNVSVNVSAADKVLESF